MRATIAKLSWSALCAATIGLSAVSTPAGAQAAPFDAIHSFDEDVFSCFTCMMPPVLGKGGVLYGLTTAGGVENWGTLYSIGTDGSYRTLHDFGGSAWIPEGQPVQAPNGDLWGVTSNETAGKHRAHGTVWRYSRAGHFRVTDSFVGTNGSFPQSLTAAPDGHLYGVTTGGGDFKRGVLFRVDDAGKLQVVHSFSARDGAITPYMQVLASSDGAFYGVSYQPRLAGRVVWRVGPDGVLTVLHAFAEDYLAGGVIEGPDGALYGQTWYGNDKTNPHGTVYRLTKDGASYTVLHRFDGQDGDEPGGRLNVDADGKLVGLTQYGGQHGYGSAFKLAIDGSGFTTLYDFDATGGYPTGINLATNGRAFGVGGAGGANDMGEVWQLALPDF